jgi:hypothetical protein
VCHMFPCSIWGRVSGTLTLRYCIRRGLGMDLAVELRHPDMRRSFQQSALRSTSHYALPWAVR